MPTSVAPLPFTPRREVHEVIDIGVHAWKSLIDAAERRPRGRTS
ncbi:hypothetical protein [Nocardia xishanensis]|nr:hypothetical protein [Nocardia xishanensis]